ncbi:hypothetical protein [Paucibacter soli]|uniref:hypothetical protein n=1 Tax=Paucibacter soli TaxID=3133433 RepID=UPI003098B12B
MATVLPPRPGRPSRHPVDVLRTQIWFRALKLASGLPSAYAIEAALEGRPGDGAGATVWRPRKWDGYERGRKVPEARPGRVDAVERAEAVFPGTARWFHSPLWRVLKREPMESHQIEAALLSLQPEVVDLLFKDDPGSLQRKRLAAMTIQHLDRLAALSSFDALVAAVLLVQLSTAVGSAELREWALTTYGILQPEVADAPETQLNYPELFTFVDRACPHWVQVSPSMRLNVHVFWHEVARKSWGQDRMDYIEARLTQLGLIQFDNPAWQSLADL